MIQLKTRKILIASGAIALMVIAAVHYFISNPASFSSLPTPPKPTPIPDLYSPVTSGIKVPEAGDKSPNRDTAVPVSVVPSKTGTGETRTFAIRASNNVFDPNTMIVNVGDAVVIKFTSVDRAYDLTSPKLGLQISAKKGETKTAEFQATAEGRYLYYCDLCGGQNSSMNGYIVITAKSAN